MWKTNCFRKMKLIFFEMEIKWSRMRFRRTNYWDPKFMLQLLTSRSSFWHLEYHAYNNNRWYLYILNWNIYCWKLIFWILESLWITLVSHLQTNTGLRNHSDSTSFYFILIGNVIGYAEWLGAILRWSIWSLRSICRLKIKVIFMFERECLVIFIIYIQEFYFLF